MTFVVDIIFLGGTRTSSRLLLVKWDEMRI